MPAEVILKEGTGGRVWDEAGKDYVDFLLGSGPMFVAHGHLEATAAAQGPIHAGVRSLSRLSIQIIGKIITGAAELRTPATPMPRFRKAIVAN